MTFRSRGTSTTALASLVAGCLALVLSGCTDEPDTLTGPSNGSVPSASPSPRVTDTPSGHSESEADEGDAIELPSPPPEYEPSWPDQTIRTVDGFPVNDCVPEELHDRVTSLSAADGTHVSALVLGDGDKGVLLGHEQGFSICSFLNLGEQLAEHGFMVMLPEYRDHGASEVSTDQTVDDFDLDVLAALHELRRFRGAEHVFVGGASCGGTTSAAAGAEHAEPVGLLIVSSPAQCAGTDALPAVGLIEGPSLFIASPGDMNGAVEAEVRSLYDASAAPEKRLEIVEGGGHGTQLFREPGSGRELQDDVVDFIVSAFP